MVGLRNDNMEALRKDECIRFQLAEEQLLHIFENDVAVSSVKLERAV